MYKQGDPVFFLNYDVSFHIVEKSPKKVSFLEIGCETPFLSHIVEKSPKKSLIFYKLVIKLHVLIFTVFKISPSPKSQILLIGNETSFHLLTVWENLPKKSLFYPNVGRHCRKISGKMIIFAYWSINVFPPTTPQAK